VPFLAFGLILNSIACESGGEEATLAPVVQPSSTITSEFARGGYMIKKRYASEQIINKLREVEVMLSKGNLNEPLDKGNPPRC